MGRSIFFGAGGDTRAFVRSKGATKIKFPAGGTRSSRCPQGSFWKSTSQSAENARDTRGFVFFFFSLAPRIPRAYKEIVSSWSSGGLHESTGLRSTSKLNTPLLRCESRTNRLKANPLAKRRSKRKKEGPHRGPSLYLQTPELNWTLVFRNSLLVFPIQPVNGSAERRATALPVDERCAGVSRRVSSRDGACDDVLRHAVWKGCSTLQGPELAGRRKVSTDKVLRQTLKECASLESPLGNPQ